MLKNTMIAAATTLALATGSLVAATGAASAQSYHSGPRYDGGHDSGWNHGRHNDRHRICKPVVRSVKVHGHHGWHWQKVVVGERCFMTNGGRW